MYYVYNPSELFHTMTQIIPTRIRHAGQQYSYSLENDMNDQAADREERKREYNRLAQREFRRRRKEHLKNLEKAQKDQNSEQSEEIERLRYQNEELRRENEALKTQIYGPSPSSSSHTLSVPINVPSLSSEGRSYSLSPSISGTSMSGHGSPPGILGSEMLPMSSLSSTSSMMTPTLHTYAEPASRSNISQPYSMVHPSGLRHNSQSSPESSGFRSPRPPMGPPFQPLNAKQSAEARTSSVQGQSRTSDAHPNLLMMVPYDSSKARADILEIFRHLLADPSIIANPSRHLAALRAMSDTLPSVLKPSKEQLETPHYYAIDMLASRSLRDRLMSISPDIAQSFIKAIGSMIGQAEDVGQILVWGDDPLNEMAWEFSQPILEDWGWLLGRDWVVRANFWRRQRGATLLPEW